MTMGKFLAFLIAVIFCFLVHSYRTLLYTRTVYFRSNTSSILFFITSDDVAVIIWFFNLLSLCFHMGKAYFLSLMAAVTIKFGDRIMKIKEADLSRESLAMISKVQ